MTSITTIIGNPASSGAGSLRFFGNDGGTGNTAIDRVVIPVDAPATAADIGSTDFTIEGWIRTDSGNNAAAPASGAVYSFITTNIFWDRDRFGLGRGFGVGLGGGRIVFSVINASNSSYTILSTNDIRDGNWHHVAVTRAQATGNLAIYVDGVQEASTTSAPSGDISYPNGATGATWDPYLVLGCEKHDADPAVYPSFYGYMASLRLSTNVRYTSNFTVPTFPLGSDANTACLYLFDEQTGTTLTDSVGGANGTLRQGGTNNGPQWSTERPA